MARSEGKATYICSTRSRYDKKYYTQHWRYRGHDYMVDVPADGNPSTDYMYGDMRPWKQHKRAQEEIVNLLDNPMPTTEPAPAKKDTEEAINKLFSYLEGDETAFD